MQAREFGNSQAELRDLNTIVVGISPDSISRLQRFAASNGISFPLGSDTTGRVRRLYDVQRRFKLGTSRITYVIDGKGIIRDVYHNEIAMASHVRRALEAVSTLQEIRDDTRLLPSRITRP